MQLSSHLPITDFTQSETGCCALPDVAAWDKQVFEFKEKPFVRFQTRNFLHVPLNMNKKIKNITNAVEAVNATTEEYVLLSEDISPWKSEHYYAVAEPVEGLDNTSFSGKYVSRVFEGPYSKAAIWIDELRDYVTHLGLKTDKTYFYYSMCPKCAKTFGKNYVIGLAKVSAHV